MIFQILEVDPGRIAWVNEDSYASLAVGDMLRQNLDDHLMWIQAKKTNTYNEGEAAGGRGRGGQLDIIINISAASTVGI